jgi:hypothetical protein
MIFRYSEYTNFLKVTFHANGIRYGTVPESIDTNGTRKERTMNAKFIATFIFTAVLLMSVNVFAGCVDYGTMMRTCSDAHGCQSEYEKTYCTFGCISGTCTAQGGSGLCCGKLYYNASIAGDGGNCNDQCSGFPSDHGYLVRTPVTDSISDSEGDGLIVMAADVRQRMPAFSFVPDHCSHTFGIAIERDFPSLSGGM